MNTIELSRSRWINKMCYAHQLPNGIVASVVFYVLPVYNRNKHGVLDDSKEGQINVVRWHLEATKNYEKLKKEWIAELTKSQGIAPETQGV